jgi:predicted DNA-binding ribbon-helix-helix protein
MERNINIETLEAEKLMNSFFNFQQILASLRVLSPEILATTSVKQLYGIADEILDLTSFIRMNVDQYLEDRKNPGMKAVEPSQSNVGGLVKINFPRV